MRKKLTAMAMFCVVLSQSFLGMALNANAEEYTVSFTLNGYSRNAEFFLDEENREVTFSATCIKYHGDNVELIDAKTNEVVATMLDDGDFFGASGDDLDNDGTWSIKLSFDDWDSGEYSYYARITDENGNVFTTEMLSVVIFDATNSDMQKDSEANQKIAELQNSDEFQASSFEQRKFMTETLLQSLVDKGYINDGTIEYLQDGLFTWIFTATGIQGYFEFTPREDGMEGGQTTTLTVTETTETSTYTNTTTFTDITATTIKFEETNTSTYTITSTDTEINTKSEEISISTDTLTSTEITSTELFTNTTISVEEATTTATITTTLPQTGYSKWYQALIATAMGMVGLGGAAIVKSGVIRKKDDNTE